MRADSLRSARVFHASKMPNSGVETMGRVRKEVVDSESLHERPQLLASIMSHEGRSGTFGGLVRARSEAASAPSPAQLV